MRQELQSVLLEFGFVLECEPEEGVAATEAELLADVCAMILNRAVTDEEQFSYLLARLVLGYQLQNSLLGWSEIL